MTNPKVKLLLLICLLAALGAVLSAFAAGSHFQMGFNDGAFNYDFKVATGGSRAASILGLIALATGLVGVAFHVSAGARTGDASASHPGPAGWYPFSACGGGRADGRGGRGAARPGGRGKRRGGRRCAAPPDQSKKGGGGGGGGREA